MKGERKSRRYDAIVFPLPASRCKICSSSFRRTAGRGAIYFATCLSSPKSACRRPIRLPVPRGAGRGPGRAAIAPPRFPQAQAPPHDAHGNGGLTRCGRGRDSVRDRPCSACVPIYFTRKGPISSMARRPSKPESKVSPMPRPPALGENMRPVARFAIPGTPSRKTVSCFWS